MRYRHRDAIIAQRLRVVTSPTSLLCTLYTHTHKYATTIDIRCSGGRGGGKKGKSGATNSNSSSRRMCNHAHIALAFVRRGKKSHHRLRLFVIDVAREPVQQRYYRLCAASTRYPNNDDCEKGTTASARARAHRGSHQSSSVRVSHRFCDARRFVVFAPAFTHPSIANNNR